MEDHSVLTTSFEKFVSKVHDPRVEGRCKHSFFDVIVISFCAILCGADSFTDIEEFGKARKDWLSKFLDLENGIPSHDTFRRVMSIIDAREFESAFMAWASEAYAKHLKRISIDGKAVAGVESKMLIRPLQLVNVYSHDSGLAIAQSLAKNSGFGELGAVLDCLDFFKLKGCLVSVDAANATSKFAHVIKKEKKADYIMPIYNSRSNFRVNVFELFEECAVEDSASTHDERHGRVEDRLCEVLSASMKPKSFREAYPAAKHVFRITRQREKEDRRLATQETRSGGTFVYTRNKTEIKTSYNVDYFVTSRKMTAEEALFEIRDHWSIENKLHWNLDVAFREDDWHVRDRIAARNLSVLRRIAFNIVARDPSSGSKRVKIKKAGWAIQFFEQVLFNPANFNH